MSLRRNLGGKNDIILKDITLVEIIIGISLLIIAVALITKGIF